METNPNLKKATEPAKPVTDAPAPIRETPADTTPAPHIQGTVTPTTIKKGAHV